MPVKQIAKKNAPLIFIFLGCFVIRILSIYSTSWIRYFKNSNSLNFIVQIKNCQLLLPTSKSGVSSWPQLIEHLKSISFRYFPLKNTSIKGLFKIFLEKTNEKIWLLWLLDYLCPGTYLLKLGFLRVRELVINNLFTLTRSFSFKKLKWKITPS
jgi:hypothetical protein